MKCLQTNCSKSFFSFLLTGPDEPAPRAVDPLTQGSADGRWAPRTAGEVPTAGSGGVGGALAVCSVDGVAAYRAALRGRPRGVNSVDGVTACSPSTASRRAPAAARVAVRCGGAVAG